MYYKGVISIQTRVEIAENHVNEKAPSGRFFVT